MFRRKHNWPRWTDAASPHNTSEIIVRSPHVPYPISLSLRRGSVLFCSLSSLPRARSSCPLGWCRPALKGFGLLFWSSGFVPHMLLFVGITCTYERWVRAVSGSCGDLRSWISQWERKARCYRLPPQWQGRGGVIRSCGPDQADYHHNHPAQHHGTRAALREKGVLVLWVTYIGALGGAYTLGAEMDRSLGETRRRDA